MMIGHIEIPAAVQEAPLARKALLKSERQKRWKSNLNPEKKKEQTEKKRAAEKKRRKRIAEEARKRRAENVLLQVARKERNVLLNIQREESFRANLTSNMLREEGLRAEANLMEMLRTLTETKKFEGLVLPNVFLEELKDLKPARVDGSIITGFYVTYHLEQAAKEKLFRILAEELPVVRLAKRYFDEACGWKGGLGMRGAVWMEGAFANQLVHADSIFVQYIAIIIHVNGGWGTRFCSPETWGPDLPLTRNQLLDIDWLNPGSIKESKYPLLKSQINEKLGKLTSEDPSYFTERTSPAVLKPAGAVTMFLADVLHYGPASDPQEERHTIFTTLRPSWEVHINSDDIQWSPVQTYYFSGANRVYQDDGFREMRKRWEDAGYDLTCCIPQESKATAKRAKKAREDALRKSGIDLPSKTPKIVKTGKGKNWRTNEDSR